MPVDFRNCSLNWVRIFKEHDCLGRDILREMLGLFTIEVLLKKIDLVVLSNGFLCSCNQIFSSLSKSKSGVSVELLVVFGDIARFGVIQISWPSYFKKINGPGLMEY